MFRFTPNKFDLGQAQLSQSLIISFFLTHAHVWCKHRSFNKLDLVFLWFVCVIASTLDLLFLNL
ncbi:hypothetical protein CY35_19G068700 [Sphagnum magellanicum]|nr:hypothetical protein CY35_19G068700 [Sphagnum magellanicum]